MSEIKWLECGLCSLMRVIGSGLWYQMASAILWEAEDLEFRQTGSLGLHCRKQMTEAVSALASCHASG